MKKLIPLYAVVFLAFLGYSMMITIFTPMMLYSSEGSLTQRVLMLGLLLALYPLGQCLGTPFILRLANRWGRRPTYLSSLILTSLGYAWIALSLDRSNLPFLFLSVFVTGLSESNLILADHAITEIALASRKPRWISFTETSTSGAFLFGPLFGGLVSQIHLSAPFWTIYFLLFASLSWLVYSFPKMKHVELHSTFWKTALRGPIRPFLINFLIYFSFTGFFRAYPMHLVHHFQMHVVELAIYITWVAIPIVLATIFFTHRLWRRYTPQRAALFGTLFTGVVMLAQPILEVRGIPLLADLFFIGLGIGCTIPAGHLLISRNVRKNRKEDIIETDESLLLGSEALSSLAGGALAIFSFHLPLTVFACTSFAAAFLLSFKKHKS